MKKLLMDEIPEKFIERQLNDSRYISKLVKRLLSNIVREKIRMVSMNRKIFPRIWLFVQGPLPIGSKEIGV